MKTKKMAIGGMSSAPRKTSAQVYAEAQSRLKAAAEKSAAAKQRAIDAGVKYRTPPPRIPSQMPAASPMPVSRMPNVPAGGLGSLAGMQSSLVVPGDASNRMAKGGMTKSGGSYRKAADGCAIRGKTRG